MSFAQYNSEGKYILGGISAAFMDRQNRTGGK